MRRSANKKGFTLVEAMIVITIIGILFSVLFQTYSRTASLALRIENEHIVANESLFLSQFLDTFSDSSELDSAAYISSNVDIDDYGFTDTLLLRQGTGTRAITHNGDCGLIQQSFSGTLRGKSCRIEAKSSDKTIKLTDPNNVYSANLRFKIFPPQAYSGNIYTQVDLKNIQSNGFQIYGDIYIKNYTPSKREMNVHQSIQTFFSMSD